MRIEFSFSWTISIKSCNLYYNALYVYCINILDNTNTNAISCNRIEAGQYLLNHNLGRYYRGCNIKYKENPTKHRPCEVYWDIKTKERKIYEMLILYLFK